MKSQLLFSRRGNGPVALAIAGWVVTLLLSTQLYASLGAFRVATEAVAAKGQVPYRLLATVLQEKLSQEEEDAPSVAELTKTLSKLAGNQQTFKGLDGMAHEAYQRTHSGDDVHDISVSGRAQRSAARLAAVAEALYACELVELAENPQMLQDGIVLDQKEVLVNVTLGDESKDENGLSLSILVIYEPLYTGGKGLEHGSILSLAKSDSDGPPPPKGKGGRLLIVLGQKSSLSTTQKIELLDEAPKKIKLSSGLVTNEVASVQPDLYKAAGNLITLLEPQLRQYNTSSVHFVGHSLAGGVASLAATMLDGSIPIPKQKTKRKAKKRRRKKEPKPETVDEEDAESASSNDCPKTDEEEEEEEVPLEPLNGLGRARSSALTLGSPPCLSSNVVAAFCTSFIYGDDIVCRTTQNSISRLEKRVDRTTHGGFIGKKLGFMSDTLSLTVSSLQTHAHGSEGEEMRLAIPGRAFLVRPRRLGGSCSIHEVGNLKKGGREALREALLWQMNDVLLSTSMWKHHELESYIHGLDRTQLRGVTDDQSHSDEQQQW
eukprot:CAMPEP_0116117510 /NCGR_PEP_ID=MMETSP0329-20121206/1611_1 /TAXON_ID=697910 /ORGANISM="Pseudo-nitzschia arenysensis, Strain B593" /LENGTH=545 /DNA_ID=CAMNT_0003611079 /DNA_START=47 /DNA_END=1684 /DNA_ORIENTATION=-